MRWQSKFALVAVTSLALSGCANINSISRLKSAPSNGEGQVFTVDAKQRHLVMSRVGGGQMRVCAEAAPDVFSAFATSIAAEGNKSGGQFGLSSTENAATIERTQTINMLRESFYRTCERYLSGAITRPQFVVQAARDQRSMVTILAIEQLTGIAKGSSTIISPGGTAASVINGGDAAKLVRDYDERLQKAKAARIEADKAVEAAKDKECSTDTDNADANADKCTALKLEATNAATAEAEAQKAMDNITQIAKDLISAASASTTAGQTFQGSTSANADATRAIGVSAAVVQLAELSFINEPLMFCLGFLSDPSSVRADSNGTVADGCMRILVTQAEADLEVRGLAGLGSAGLRAFAAGSLQAISTTGLLDELKAKIDAADEDELPTLIAKFEEAAGLTEVGITIVDSCDRKETCKDAATYVYPRQFAEDLGRAESALSIFE